VRHVLERLVEQALGADLVDDAVHGGPCALEAPGECLHGDFPPVRVVNYLLRLGVQRPRHRREQGLARVLAVEVLDRVADRLGAAPQAAGDPAAHLGQRAARVGQPAGAAEDVFLLLLRHLREPAAALHALLVGGDERLHQAGQKAQLPAAVVQEGQPDQAALLPPVDRLRRDVESLAQLLQRQDRLRRRLHRPRRD